MRLNIFLTVVCLLIVANASYVLLNQSLRANRNFERDLNQQRLFMQIAFEVAAPEGCRATLGPLAETWDRVTPISLKSPKSNVQIKLIAGPSIEVRVDELRREIPLELPACRLNSARARFEVASFVTGVGGTPAVWSGFVRRCPAGQFLTRQPDPFGLMCLDFPP